MGEQLKFISEIEKYCHSVGIAGGTLGGGQLVMENSYTPPFESKLVRRLLNGQFAITAEITPPVSGLANDVLVRADPLKDLVDAVNVTDGSNANVRMSSVASSSIL